MSRSVTKLKSVKTLKEAGATQNKSILHPAADMIVRQFSFGALIYVSLVFSPM